MINTKTKETKINKTTIKESLPVHKCDKCGNTELIHINFDIENIDTSWDEEMIEFLDGYYCINCKYIISKDENHTSTQHTTQKVDDFDVRSSTKRKNPYQGAF